MFHTRQIEAILEDICNGLIIHERSGNIRYANRPASRLLGFQSVVELVQSGMEGLKRRLHVVNQRCRPLITAPYPWEQIENGSPSAESLVSLEGNHPVRRSWIMLESKPLFDESGRRDGVITTLQDVTEYKLIESRLEHSLSLLQATLDSTMDGILVVDRKGEISGFNRRFAEMWRIPRKILESQNDEQALSFVISQVKSPDEFILKVEQLYSDPSAESYDLIEFRDGRVFERYSRPQELGEHILGRVWSFNDVTRQKQTEHELKKAKEQADHANQSKTAFLANVSHEIRTPLGAVLGFADLMMDPQQSFKEIDAYPAIIKRNAQLLQRLVNDLLDLSKVEAGKLDIERISTDLGEFLQDVFDTMQSTARAKSIGLELRKNAPIPEHITTDPTRLRQILVNIIGNAIKFTDQGQVTVSVKMENEKIQFIVRDQGQGISEESAQRLFRPFAQGSASVSRQYGGTGLGLTLSRKLARALGGDVTLLESTLKVGSVFVVSIDPHPYDFNMVNRRPEAAFQKQDEGPIRLEGMKILLVEDGPDNQLLFSKYLLGAGAELGIADDGMQALEMAARVDYDLILMDIQMPTMDGYTATRRLRERGYRRPIIALTAHAMQGEREQCLRCGCDEYLTKPLAGKVLLQKVASFKNHYAPLTH